MAMRLAAALLAVCLLLAGRRASCQSGGAANPLSCTCTDVDPRVGEDKHLKFVEQRCFRHWQKGECDKGFMFSAIQELSEGYCQITCSRCDCCRTLRNVAADEGLTDWIWAMETAGLGRLFTNPGWEVAALVPKNGALDPMLATFGWTRADVESDVGKQRALQEVLKFNIIPAIPDFWAVYTAPFVEAGMEMHTLFDDNATLRVNKWETGGTGFQGPHGSATVQDSDWDKPSCKGYIDITDKYVLPFINPDRFLENPTEIGATTGHCEAASEVLYDGEVRDRIMTASAEECCDTCQNERDCNIWTFCARRSGCHKGGDSPPIAWGTCDLKWDSDFLRIGRPTAVEKDFLTPYHSGVSRKDPKESKRDSKSG